MNTIKHFRGEYGFLSNFYPCHISYQGSSYYSIEHAYQAAKTDDPAYKHMIRTAKTPALSKKLGNKASMDKYKIKIRKSFEHEKLQIMEDLLRLKFQIPELKEKLLATGNASLIEGNNWNDSGNDALT